MPYPKISSLNTSKKLAARLAALNLELPLDAEMVAGDSAPLAQTLDWQNKLIGNRFAILPMEGWDGTLAGQPSELTIRRWRRFGESGAKLIWGGEAVAVRGEGRANPHQLLINDANLTALEGLRDELEKTHMRRFGCVDDLLVGLQLTHSGRFSNPDFNRQRAAPLVYRHPHLDALVNVQKTGFHVLTDSEIYYLIDDFIQAAVLAEKAGFGFVDIKHCHGYFGHELLSAYDRPGDFGGSFENRTRFLREIVKGIQNTTHEIGIGVRLSVFDFCPFMGNSHEVGVPQADGDYPFGFGADATGSQVDLTEPLQFIDLLSDLGIRLVCTTAGSPYYCPHIQRPAQYPPSDGYQAPEDPLVGVTRQINATSVLKQRCPDLIFVGSGYSYLQEWLPHVGQAAVRANHVDAIGLGRMALAYHDLPADVLAGKPLRRRNICRTFSDCTTAPRQGLVSGCFPLDPLYKKMPERKQLIDLKRGIKKS